MSKLNYDTSPRDCIIRLCDGNPGAIDILVRLLDDSKGGIAGYLDFHRLDDAQIYGGNIWVAYKDVCGEDLDVFRAALRDGSLRVKLEASPRYEAMASEATP